MSNTSSPALVSSAAAETTSALDYSRMFLLGNVLAILAYGFIIALFAAILPLLWTKMEPLAASARRRRPYGTAVFAIVLFLLNTIYLVSTILMMENAYVDNADNSGGFLAFLAFLPTLSVEIVNQVPCVIGSLLADAFLLIRTRAILRAVGGRYLQLLLIPGVAMLVLSAVLSILYSVDLLSPDGIVGNQTINWALLYFIISFANNAYLTLLIALRIWIYQRGASKVLGGGDGHGRFYATYCAMFIESAALYLIIAFGSVVTYNNPMTMVWQSLALPVQTIASFLITYRVARGRAWEVSAIHSTSRGAWVRGQMDKESIVEIGKPPVAETWA